MICSVCVSTMYTVVLLVEMNNRVPSGETRTTNGFPAGVKIVDTCWEEATSITPTFWSHWLVTYAVPPAGTAKSAGSWVHRTGRRKARRPCCTGANLRHWRDAWGPPALG